MFDLQYDIPVEVNENQYKALSKSFGGVIAMRIDSGKYFIKLWMMKYKLNVEELLNSIK